MIEVLVPASVVTVETRSDLLEVELFPEEVASVGNAVEKRRREFVTGRACARRALERLGVGPVPIASGEKGEPLWPDGVVGSITHCDGFRACAAAMAGDIASVGIDAEVHVPLPDGVLESVSSPQERRRLAGHGADVCFDKLLFSAKESIYKAWFPLARRWLGFEDVELSIDPRDATFRARLLVEGPLVGGERLTEFRGRWAVEDGVVAAAVVVSA
ncbi:MAG TPA: 4'-phosphopantetheinyl transferase superfamily protein [Thermoleophilaceae bacterium]